VHVRACGVTAAPATRKPPTYTKLGSTCGGVCLHNKTSPASSTVVTGGMQMSPLRAQALAAAAGPGSDPNSTKAKLAASLIRQANSSSSSSSSNASSSSRNSSKLPAAVPSSNPFAVLPFDDDGDAVDLASTRTAKSSGAVCSSSSAPVSPADATATSSSSVAPSAPTAAPKLPPRPSPAAAAAVTTTPPSSTGEHNPSDADIATCHARAGRSGRRPPRAEAVVPGAEPAAPPSSLAALAHQWCPR
jgi:hypothetical protein